MPAIMEQLKSDHKNVARLLNTLADQMELVRREENADFELIHDIMVYMTHYPDHTHHPMEDLIFDRLIAHDESAMDVVARLQREHRALSEKGSRFREMLRHVVDGSLVERDVLEEAGRDYVEFLRAHMSVEDNEAFPLAEQKLTGDDWVKVESGMQARTDPVFGTVVAEEFRSLFEYIQRES